MIYWAVTLTLLKIILKGKALQGAWLQRVCGGILPSTKWCEGRQRPEPIVIWKTLKNNKGNFQKLCQVYILRLAKKLYPKWLKVSGQAVGLSQLLHDC